MTNQAVDISKPDFGIYIHIPFCEKKCDYCDFNSYQINPDQMSAWRRSFTKELSARLKYTSPPSTLYIGGGTPSVLSNHEFSYLIETLSRLISFDNLKEFTIEANPSSLNHSKLEQYQKSGATRISLGVQSFDNRILKLLGRIHNKKHSLHCLKILKESRLPFSLDIMFGIPGQSPDQFIKDVETALSFTPAHISLYGLSIEKHTPFFHRLKSGSLTGYPNPKYDSMYLKAASLILSNGYERYEVSNFCLDGRASWHNQNYWNHTPYLGLGPGAHSFIDNIRFEIPKNLEEYVQWAENGCQLSQLQLDKISLKKKYAEALWLGLRTSKGIHPDTLCKSFRRQPSQEKLNSWVKQKYLIKNQTGSYCLFEKGWLYLDAIAVDLLPDEKKNQWHFS